MGRSADNERIQTGWAVSDDATDAQWEGLAQVVPLRGGGSWPGWSAHESAPEARTENRRRFVVLRVNVFADAREVAETLMNHTPVLLDLSGAETDVAKRVLDFSSGVVFGLGSAMHRVDRNVFLLAPAGTQIQDLVGNTAV